MGSDAQVNLTLTHKKAGAVVAGFLFMIAERQLGAGSA
jgi:hypothetical protein